VSFYFLCRGKDEKGADLRERGFKGFSLLGQEVYRLMNSLESREFLHLGRGGLGKGG